MTYADLQQSVAAASSHFEMHLLIFFLCGRQGISTQHENMHECHCLNVLQYKCSLEKNQKNNYQLKFYFFVQRIIFLGIFYIEVHQKTTQTNRIQVQVGRYLIFITYAVKYLSHLPQQQFYWTFLSFSCSLMPLSKLVLGQTKFLPFKLSFPTSAEDLQIFHFNGSHFENQQHQVKLSLFLSSNLSILRVFEHCLVFLRQTGSKFGIFGGV